MNPQMNDYKKTVAKCSKDDDGNSLIDDNTFVYSLDDYAEYIGKEFRSKKSFPSSVDAFAFGENHQFYFIEFKNARKSRINHKMLASKAFDSLYLGQLLLNRQYSVETMAQRSFFFVVFQDPDGIK